LKKKRGWAKKVREQTLATIAKEKLDAEKANEAANVQRKKDVQEAEKARKVRVEAAKAAREADEKEHQAEMKAIRDFDKK